MAALRAAARLHILVAKGLKPLDLLQHASNYIKSRAPNLTNKVIVQPAYARVPRQPVHPRAWLKQSRRWFSNSTRLLLRELQADVARAGPRRLPESRVYNALKSTTGSVPFTHTLRPNLTGGAFPRTASGYSLGCGRVGGQRYFSHTPQAPAQVLNNVSQAMRAFAVGGGRVQYDGIDARTGEKRYKTVSNTCDHATKTIKSVPKATPGSFIDFNINPTITAFTSLGSVTGFSECKAKQSLNSEGLLDVLSTDFARALKELVVILDDIKALSALGDLPISYQNSALRIHFPGCDAATVENLMEEFGLSRGSIGQDPEFDTFVGTEIALMFPYAPSKTQSEYSYFSKPLELRDDFFRQPEMPPSPHLGTLDSPDFSVMSDDGLELFEELSEADIDPWLSSPSGYETLRSSDAFDSGHAREDRTVPLEYQNFESLYQFLELCDNTRR